MQFKFATTLDKMLILSGALAAVCGGAALPVLMILKGIAVQVGIIELLMQHVVKVLKKQSLTCYLVPFLRALLMMLVWEIMEKQLTSPTMIEKKKCLQL